MVYEGLLIVSAFVPCMLFAALARWTEVHQRQSLRSVIAVFAMGASVSVLLALFLEIISQFVITDGLNVEAGGMLSAFLGAAILAPIIEEYTKAVPIRGIKRSPDFSEVEDGLIYGAAAGFGFAASENFLYFLVAWRRALLLPPGLGFASLLVTIIVRTIGAACLHGAASSIVGYGIARNAFLRGTWLTDYAKAVGIHGVYNLSIFSFGFFLSCGVAFLCPAPLIFSLMIGIGFFSMTLNRIRKLDEMPNVQPVYCAVS